MHSDRNQYTDSAIHRAKLCRPGKRCASPMFMGMMVIMMSLAGVIKKLFPLAGIYSAAGMVMLVGAFILIPIFKYKPAPLNSQAAAPEMH